MTAATPLALIIDQGGHASRALVFDRQGTAVAHAYRPLPTHRPQPGWVEHDAEALIASVQTAMADAMAPLATQSGQVMAAALACQRSSIVCWDRITAEALSPVLSWQDTRATQWLAAFDDEAATVEHVTGLRLSPHYGASKLRWCLDHLPQVQDAATQDRLRIGPLASFIADRLLTTPAGLADPANASRTLLWNLDHRDWDPHLLELFHIPPSILPTCCASDGPFGELGIAGRGLPLRLVTGDQNAALFAQGPPDPDVVYINMGTGVFIQRVTASPCRVDGLLTGIAHCDRQGCLYTLEGTINGGARALEWLADRQGIDHLNDQLPRWLAEAETPGYFLNGIAGLAAPYWRADFASRFIDASEPRQMAVAVVDSILFLINLIMERMSQKLTPPRRIVVSGGLAQMDGLCQRLADTCQREVHRPPQVEATARGAAFLALGAPATWTLETPSRFNPDKKSSIPGRFGRWKELMEGALNPPPQTLKTRQH